MRERETCSTSNQGRVRERESDHEREATRERDMQHASIQGRVSERERVTMTERQRERHTHATRVTKEE